MDLVTTCKTCKPLHTCENCYYRCYYVAIFTSCMTVSRWAVARICENIRTSHCHDLCSNLWCIMMPCHNQNNIWNTKDGRKQGENHRLCSRTPMLKRRWLIFLSTSIMKKKKSASELFFVRSWCRHKKGSHLYKLTIFIEPVCVFYSSVHIKRSASTWTSHNIDVKYRIIIMQWPPMGTDKRNVIVFLLLFANGKICFHGIAHIKSIFTNNMPLTTIGTMTTSSTNTMCNCALPLQMINNNNVWPNARHSNE